MEALHIFMRFYPVFALSVIPILIHLGLHLYRKKSPYRFAMAALAVFFVVTAVLWVVYRGDLNADNWVRDWVNF